jgi:hypothetical protein
MYLYIPYEYNRKTDMYLFSFLRTDSCRQRTWRISQEPVAPISNDFDLGSHSL